MSAEPTASSSGTTAHSSNNERSLDEFVDIAIAALENRIDAMDLVERNRMTDVNAHVLKQSRKQARTREVESVPDTIRKYHSEFYPSEVARYGEDEFNIGIRALGIDYFLSVAAKFCKDEALPVSPEQRTYIISVGSGDGQIAKSIIRAHRQRFGKDIDIMLIDEDPTYINFVDFQTVDILIESKPHIVGHCVVFIIWPEYSFRSENYDIKVLQRLQPLAALTVYEMTGTICNTGIWSCFLYDDSLDDLLPSEMGVLNYECKSVFANRFNWGLDNYVMEELAHHRIRIGPLMGTTAVRIVKLKRNGDARSYEEMARVASEGLKVAANVRKRREKDYYQVERIREEHEQLVAKEQSLETGGDTENSDDLRLVLAKLGIYDRHLDYDYLVKYAKVDYFTLNPINDIDYAKIMLNAHLSLTELPDFRDEVKKLRPSQSKKHDLCKHKDGVIGLGVDDFLSAAVQFCREARRGTIEIISVGSGDGYTEKCITAAYHQRFGKEIRIKLVESELMYKTRANFESVDDLIAKRPYVVGHCGLFLLWPNRAGQNKGEDIDAIRRLKPNSALIVYENTGRSGSHTLREFLHDDSLDLSPSSDEFGLQNYLDQSCRTQEKDFGLPNYLIQEIARQKVHLRPISGTFTIRMVKLKRM